VCVREFLAFGYLDQQEPGGIRCSPMMVLVALVVLKFPVRSCIVQAK